MRIEINRLLAPVTVLGHGKRIALWTQGCRLACAGCASVDTWIPGQGTEIDVEELAARMAAEVISRGLNGVTFTGGEPVDQADALSALLSALRSRLEGWPGLATLDVLLFTGYHKAAAAKRAGPLWQMIDAAVCGPYRRDEPSTAPLVASANQELCTLTELGGSRYPIASKAPRMQVVADGRELLMVGLPRAGDLNLLEERLSARGVQLGGVSWRS